MCSFLIKETFSSPGLEINARNYIFQSKYLCNKSIGYLTVHATVIYRTNENIVNICGIKIIKLLLLLLLCLTL